MNLVNVAGDNDDDFNFICIKCKSRYYINEGRLDSNINYKIFTPEK